MLPVAEINLILNKHEQKRPLSCFQSAVEMVLKLHGVVAEGEYPEQDIVANDQRGYEPFAGKEKQYGETHVSFEEIKFEPLGGAVDKGRELLKEGVYPIFSFMWPDGSGFHGFVGFQNEGGDLSFFTKKSIGVCLATRLNLPEIIFAQVKTEILVVRILPKK